MGIEATVAALRVRVAGQLAATPLSPWSVAGKPAGLVKNVENFSYTRVAGAGHEVRARAAGRCVRG